MLTSISFVFRSTLAIVAIAAGMTIISQAEPEGAVSIRISYKNRLKPVRLDREEIVTNQTATVVLSGRNAIQEKWSSQSSRGMAQASDKQYVLGEDKTVQWHVGGPNNLMRTIDYLQSSTVIVITVTGEKSCQVSIAHALKPGFREFVFPRWSDGQMRHYSDIKAEDASCQIE